MAGWILPSLMTIELRSKDPGIILEKRKAFGEDQPKN
jgi:hypothetical protein